MNDQKTTLQQLKEEARTFIDERDWGQFHDPKNLAMALSVEVAELVELLMWTKSDKVPERVNEARDDIEDEAADVLHALLAFANVCNIDMSAAFEKKMVKNKAKYPIEAVRGKCVKYTDVKTSKGSTQE